MQRKRSNLCAKCVQVEASQEFWKQAGISKIMVFVASPSLQRWGLAMVMVALCMFIGVQELT